MKTEEEKFASGRRPKRTLKTVKGPSAAREKASAPPSKKPKLDCVQTARHGTDDPRQTAKSSSLNVGDKLDRPIVLKDEEGNDLDLLQTLKANPSIIFLYPKANTPGCTNQACGYRDIYEEIRALGFQVFGLSMDSPKSQKNWKVKQNLPFQLLCDPKQELIKALGGSKSATQVQRSHYIIDNQTMKILNVTSPASAKSSPKQALEFIKSIK